MAAINACQSVPRPAPVAIASPVPVAVAAPVAVPVATPPATFVNTVPVGTAPATFVNTSAVVPPYTAQNYVVYSAPGTDITTVPNPQTGTLASCVSMCSATPGCLGFSRRKSAADTDATQQCYLKQNLSLKTNNDSTWQTWVPSAPVIATSAVSTPASIQVTAPYINNSQLFNATKKVLDCAGGVCNQNTPLQAWDPNSNGGQRFTFKPSSADPTIGTLVSNNICVDVPNSSTALGTQLQTYPCNGTAAQKLAVFAQSCRRLDVQEPQLWIVHGRRR